MGFIKGEAEDCVLMPYVLTRRLKKIRTNKKEEYIPSNVPSHPYVLMFQSLIVVSADPEMRRCASNLESLMGVTYVSYSRKQCIDNVKEYYA